MQEGLSASPTWIHTAAQWVVSFVVSGGILKLINLWQNRHKPAAEIHVTEATAAEITVRAGSTAGDAIMRFMGRLEQAQASIDRLRMERDGWEGQYDEVFVDRARLQREHDRLLSENASYEKQIRRMHRTLAENNVNYDNTQDMPVQPLD
jgi:hypothetical protein